MSTHLESSTKRGRSVIYIVSMILLVIFAVVALLNFRSARETQQSLAKADQLIAEINAAGGTAPSREQIARVLGDDGGAVCANPNDALSRATFHSQLTNGATGPGNRPVIANDRIAKGELAIIKIYCPDKLADFQQFIDGLNTYNSGGG
jgi:type II secretory pathway pseudopilin PulG